MAVLPFRQQTGYTDKVPVSTDRLLCETAAGLPFGVAATNLPLAIAGGANGLMSGTDKTKLNRLISVKDYGAVGDGIANDSAAFAAFRAANPWEPFYVPRGVYRLTAPLALNNNGRLFGDGPALSWLVWDSGNGVVFTSSADDNEILHVSDLTFRTKAAGGTALKADFSAQIDGSGHSVGRDKTRFLVQNCVFQPNGSIETTGWATCFDLIAGLIGQVRDCNFFGRVGSFVSGWPIPASNTFGCKFHGVGDEGEFNGRPVQFVVDGCTFNALDFCVQFLGCEGGFVTASNMVGVGTGVIWESAWVQRPQLNVSNSHINAYEAGIHGIDLADLQVNGTLFYNFANGQPPSAGILCSGTLGCLTPCIIGNTFVGVLQHMNGVVISKGTDGIIANNIFRGEIDTAIWLQAGASHFRGQTNLIATVPNVSSLVNQGTNNSIGIV